MTFFFDNDKALPAMIESNVIDGSYDMLNTLWHGILRRYTQREMTFDCDKIAAISGIADLISHRIGDTLIHGLWEKNVLASLVWKVDEKNPAR